MGGWQEWPWGDVGRDKLWRALSCRDRIDTARRVRKDRVVRIRYGVSGWLGGMSLVFMGV